MLAGLCLTSSAFLYTCNEMYIQPLKKFYKSNCKPYIDHVKDFYKTTFKPRCCEYLMALVIRVCLFYKLFLQTMRGTLTPIGRNKHEICYYVGMRRYKMHINTRPFPSQVIQITDETEDTVTDNVLEYMGPRKDFHNIGYSPSDLGYKSLTFYMIDGDTKTFSEKEIIRLT